VLLSEDKLDDELVILSMVHLEIQKVKIMGGVGTMMEHEPAVVCNQP
jgi:hypothetical protein